MRRNRFTFRNIVLLIAAVAIVAGLARWGSLGFPMPGAGVPSTSDRIVFVSDRAGKNDVWIMDAKEGGKAEALTQDDMDDREPVFSPDGQTIVFTSNRQKNALGLFATGVVRHLFIMQAAPGQPLNALTQSSASSGTKEHPRFPDARAVYFLDGGRIHSIAPDASDPLAIFPTAQQRRGNSLISELFDRGGVVDFAVSNDGTWIAAVVKREDDQTLVVYDTQNKIPAAIAVGQRIKVTFLPDGAFLAAIDEGSPVKEPIPFTDEMATKVGSLAALLPSSADAYPDTHVLVRFRFGNTLSVDMQTELPGPVAGVANSPDGKTVALIGGGNAPGLVVVDLGSSAAMVLETREVESVSFAPDSKRLVYAAAGDLWLVPTSGQAAPVNLTNGQGKNRQPVWSPATR